MLKFMSRVRNKCWLWLPLLALAAPSFSQATTTYTNTVFAFDASLTLGGVVVGVDGALYGTTYNTSLTSGGMIYRTTVDGANPQNWYQLGDNQGYSPRTSLLASSDGYFYGTTHYGVRAGLNYARGSGTVFKISQSSKAFTTLHTFADISDTTTVANTDGAYPDIALAEGADGYLYGATVYGGASGTGTLFRILKDGTGFQTLHQFPALDSSGYNTDGAYPNGKLLLASDGRLYGVASSGGAAGKGVVYSLAPDGSGFAAVYAFTALDSSGNNADGATPRGALAQVGTTLYGTTTDGGTSSYGTVYSLVTDGTAANTTLTTLHNFSGTAPNDGAIPTAGLILADDNRLYGTTTTGVANSDNTSTTAYGTVFAITTDGSAFEVLHIFVSSEGSSPQSELTKLGSNTYFGTTGASGACGYGTVFRISLTGALSSDGHVSCETVNTGGGSMAPGLLLLLSGLGMAPPLRRRWMA